MNKYIAVVICTCFLLVSSQSYASDGRGFGVLMGAGTQSCGKMTDDVQKTHDGKTAYKSWIEGYLSGVNMYLEGKENYFEGVDSIAAYKFVLKYCEDNPLDHVGKAVIKLVNKYVDPALF